MHENQLNVLETINACAGIFAVGEAPGRVIPRQPEYKIGTLVVSTETDKVYLYLSTKPSGFNSRCVEVVVDAVGSPGMGEFIFPKLVEHKPEYRAVEQGDDLVNNLVKLGKAELYHFNFGWDQSRNKDEHFDRLRDAVSKNGGMWLSERSPATFNMARKRFITRFGLVRHERIVSALLLTHFAEDGKQIAAMTAAPLVGPYTDSLIHMNHNGDYQVLSDPEIIGHPDLFWTPHVFAKEKLDAPSIYFFGIEPGNWTEVPIP